jgi:RNA recognition motif-containing protein
MIWVYIGNLDKELNKSKLENAFEKFGKCTFEYIVK